MQEAARARAGVEELRGGMRVEARRLRDQVDGMGEAMEGIAEEAARLKTARGEAEAREAALQEAVDTARKEVQVTTLRV